jgi:hypothetical protein
MVTGGRDTPPEYISFKKGLKAENTTKTLREVEDKRRRGRGYSLALSKNENARPTGDFLTGKCYGLKWRHRVDLYFFTSRDFRDQNLSS